MAPSQRRWEIHCVPLQVVDIMLNGGMGLGTGAYGCAKLTLSCDEEQNDVWRVSKSRLQYWPRLYERHIHQAQGHDIWASGLT